MGKKVTKKTKAAMDTATILEGLQGMDLNDPGVKKALQMVMKTKGQRVMTIPDNTSRVKSKHYDTPVVRVIPGNHTEVTGGYFDPARLSTLLIGRIKTHKGVKANMTFGVSVKGVKGRQKWNRADTKKIKPRDLALGDTVYAVFYDGEGTGPNDKPGNEALNDEGVSEGRTIYRGVVSRLYKDAEIFTKVQFEDGANEKMYTEVLFNSTTEITSMEGNENLPIWEAPLVDDDFEDALTEPEDDIDDDWADVE